MAYSTINNPTDHFRTKLYTGNSTDNTTITWDETGTNFGTNLFLWLKQRTVASQEHWLTDSIRGGAKYLESNGAVAEVNAGGNWGYATNGFVLDDNARTNRGTMVGWGWKAAASAANTDGSISSTVSANTTAGFSIVSYTGTGAAGTVGHGLGVAPDMMIVKNRDTTNGWRVYFRKLGATSYIALDGSSASGTSSAIWNDTHPTSSVFSIGSGNSVTGSGNNLIAYCFANTKGYSKFGKYKGNGNANGTFVYTGFKPAFVMFRGSAASRQWVMQDSKRNTFNPMNKEMWADTSDTEQTETRCDFLSNGFKLRTNTTYVNGSGFSYYYMAFAENPLVANVTGGIPATAR